MFPAKAGSEKIVLKPDGLFCVRIIVQKQPK